MSKIETAILNGNELILQGAKEAGFHLYTGYPGSPLADYFNILYEKRDDFKSLGARVVIANNEASAAAMAGGAKQVNKNVIVAMKSMGLHVASDALSVGNFANPGLGGVVIVVGDDPWSMSTSSPADSRYLFKHLHIPFLDPSTPQELKDWIKIALKLSVDSSLYVGVLLTTFMAEGGGLVEIGEEKKLDNTLLELDPSTFNLTANVMVPPNSLLADKKMIEERFPKLLDQISKLSLDKVYGNINSKIGFISSGIIFEVLKSTLDDYQLLDIFSLYKIAIPYPLAKEKLLVFLKGIEKLVVVEEKRGFLEGEIRELISNNNLKIEVVGKKIGDEELFYSHGGINYEMVENALVKLDKFLNLTFCHEIKKSIDLKVELPKRLPTFCPGCPHRETLSILKDLRAKLLEKNIKLITHGDVGCYSLSFLPPFKEMHNLSGMGQGGALGSGVDLFTTNPSVVLMGDSTFFHSGITNISNSVQEGHDITYIILDNSNTAMTGHQMTPRSGVSVDGVKRPLQDIQNIVKAMGVTHCENINPSDRYFYSNLIFELIKLKGVKVIISTKECGLTFHARKKSHERKMFSQNQTIKEQTFYQINTDACEDCRECVNATGCPGLTLTHDPYGTKVAIDPQICVSDSYCTKIKACPSFYEIKVTDFHPTKYKKNNDNKLDLESISLRPPTLLISPETIMEGIDYSILITGVGGSGITTVSKILSKAVHELSKNTGIDFKFMDQKGLAQRNGNVSSHLSFFRKGKSKSPIVKKTNIDLILSSDLLDGINQYSGVSEKTTLVLDRKYQIPLSQLLDKEIDAPLISDNNLIEMISKINNHKISLVPFKELSEHFLGRSVYVSTILIGAAFQLGTLPFSELNLIDAIKASVPKNEIDNNILAFNLGRRYILAPSRFDSILLRADSKVELYEKSVLDLWGPKGQAYFKKYLKEMESTFAGLEKEDLARYVHDLLIYHLKNDFHSFFNDGKKLKAMYGNEIDLLKISLRTLVRTYFVKDEVFISHIMISPIEDSRNQYYRELGTSIKRNFINRPAINLTESKVISFDFSPKVWMLKVLRRLQVLRILFPHWHKLEKEMAKIIRSELLNKKLGYTDLKHLENVKGYRDVRYLAFNLRNTITGNTPSK